MDAVMRRLVRSRSGDDVLKQGVKGLYLTDRKRR